MKIIEILQKVANGEIEKGTKLWLEECSFNFDGDRFTNEQHPFGNSIFLSTRFLNKEVELIEPKPKKYMIKLNVRGLYPQHNYVNYYNSGIKQWIEFRTKSESAHYQTEFTEDELQYIKPVKEFLDDMQGKYKLVEVTEDEDY
ncbi:hypothetical protein [Enterococcus cecorum]|uniref:hypothetical protein n=1 Tax=Enterococcus cecorum TaxID=44008 RepID=UPI00148E4AC7|nr:hypothetical protein [Enterococcus cecorum]